MANESTRLAGGLADKLGRAVRRVYVGRGEAVELLLVVLLAEGHALVEDVPGIGKTTLAKAVARGLGCSFRRLQFTADVLPSDVTGVHVFSQRSGEFELRPGPVFANVVLADEVNRATPRTQSSLLEAMEERQVTVDGETLPLPRPFVVLATQNPVELEGTFPLPEAQLDRFLLRVELGYPEPADEKEIVRRFGSGDPLAELEPVLTREELLELQRAAREVKLHEVILDYAVSLSQATRRHPGVQLGASPRATLSLCRAAKALALLRGRDFVLPDDVKYLAVPVLGHRLITTAQFRLRGQGTAEILGDILERVPVPVETVAGG